MKLFLRIRFVGTRYAGWQYQNNAPTVQGKLTEACRTLFGFDCDVTGCSRTDAGVHALGFCATVAKKGESGISTAIPVNKIPYALNNLLPDDISVMEAGWREDNFHARYSVCAKTYIYRFLVSAQPDPFETGRATHCPRPMMRDSLERMRAAARHFVGTHDFTSFMASGSKIVDAVRSVRSADVEKNGDIVTFTVSADGFLYNMVRIMAGTLSDVAYGKIEPDDVPAIICARDRRKAGPTLPPDGLYLAQVSYHSPEEPEEEAK